MLVSQILIEKSPLKILKYLKIGISIPVLPQFQKYIINTFKNYNVRALFLIENGVPVGMTILFNENKELLFFGFFRVIDHSEERIQSLLEYVLTYARENNFHYIRGPVNIPVIIFGFGFMTKGSKEDMCIGKPVNPPQYLNIFENYGFYTKYKEDSYFTKTNKFDHTILKDLNFSDYEYITPGREHLDEYLDDMVQLHINNMKGYSQITPNTDKNVEILFEYIFDLGSKNMVWVIRHKPSNKVVGTGHIAPDPFRKNFASFEHFVIDKSHQGKGLGLFMLSKSIKANSPYVKYGSGSYAPENTKIINLIVNHLGGIKDRQHVILEYKIKS